MIVDSFTSRLYIRMEDNVLMYNDGKSSFELPRDLPLILDEIRNLKIEVKPLREVAEAGRLLANYVEECWPGLHVTDAIRLSLDKLDEARRG
jgi:hypothetical protein